MLANVRTDSSPHDPAFLRSTGTFEMASGERLEVWFEVPVGLAAGLSVSAAPWLVAMLPYGLSRGEDIVAESPVDAQLLENLRGLVSVWCSWYPNFKPPAIVAPAAPLAAKTGPSGLSAAFFSGGIDAWFTALRHAREIEPAAIDNIDELIAVHGFDIPLEARAEFDKLQTALTAGAEQLGRDLVVVRTNLRRPDSIWHSGWSWLTHGAGLACVALVLERRYRQVAIASSTPYENLFPWGSHPLTDPLLSTSALRIKHDGAAFNRVEKTAFIARHAFALANLHVCWVNQAASNCGECAKCIRTMAALHLLGALESSGAFPGTFTPEKLARMYVDDPHDEEFLEELHDLAASTGRQDVQKAALRAVRRSRRTRPMVAVVERLRYVPLIWRYAPRMRKWLTN